MLLPQKGLKNVRIIAPIMFSLIAYAAAEPLFSSRKEDLKMSATLRPSRLALSLMPAHSRWPYLQNRVLTIR